ncbi:MAG: DUF1499 domain-containing protein, partial [Planctomycetota bacterium]
RRSMMLLLAAAALLATLIALQGCAAPDVGLTAGGRLAPCPASPNCVCSEAAASEDSFISAFAVPEGEEPRAAFERLVGLLDSRARVAARDGDWVHAVFTTRILRFRDDVELRLDEAARVVHVRSASRLGYSDLGANRARVERLREAFAAGAAE